MFSRFGFPGTLFRRLRRWREGFRIDPLESEWYPILPLQEPPRKGEEDASRRPPKTPGKRKRRGNRGFFTELQL